MSDSSTTMPSPQPEGLSKIGRPPSKRRARPWHRVLGLLAALPLVWVVISGAVLNHTVDWQLDRIMVQHAWVLAAYGMNPDGEAMGVRVGPHHVVEWDGLVFVDGVIAPVAGKLIGAVADGEGLAVVTETQVLRLDGGGEPVETLGEITLPALPLAAVHGDGQIHLKNDEGWHRVGEGWLDFEREDGAFDGIRLERLGDGDERDALRVAWSEGGLPLSRVLLDAHAGRFLGSFSKYFYDLVAVATVWLCATGLVLFFRKPRRSR